MLPLGADGHVPIKCPNLAVLGVPVGQWPFLFLLVAHHSQASVRAHEVEIVGAGICVITVVTSEGQCSPSCSVVVFLSSLGFLNLIFKHGPHQNHLRSVLKQVAAS